MQTLSIKNTIPEEKNAPEKGWGKPNLKRLPCEHCTTGKSIPGHCAGKRPKPRLGEICPPKELF